MARRVIAESVEMVPIVVSRTCYEQALDDVAAALLELSGQLRRKSPGALIGPDSSTSSPSIDGRR